MPCVRSIWVQVSENKNWQGIGDHVPAQINSRLRAVVSLDQVSLTHRSHGHSDSVAWVGRFAGLHTSPLFSPRHIYLNSSCEYTLNNSISKLVWKIKDKDPKSTRKKFKSYIFQTNVLPLTSFDYWFLTLSQWSHWYGFVGWWVIKCSFRWLACVYVFSHLSHLNGRSPVCCLKNNDF